MQPSSAEDWNYHFEDSKRTFTAELRPRTLWLGRISCVAIVCTTILGAASWSLASQGFLVVAILAACATAFPVGLWLGMRQSFWRLTIDTDRNRVCIEEKRSFDPVLRFESDLEQLVLAYVQDASIGLGWTSDSNTGIHLPFRSPEEANRVHDQLHHWLTR